MGSKILFQIGEKSKFILFVLCFTGDVKKIFKN